MSQACPSRHCLKKYEYKLAFRLSKSPKVCYYNMVFKLRTTKRRRYAMIYGAKKENEFKWTSAEKMGSEMLLGFLSFYEKMTKC